MRAIILAGGIGKRLRDIVKDVPKPMAQVAGKPFLEYLVLQLIKWNIKQIVLSVGYKKDIVESYFGTGEKWGIKIQYSKENKPLGTGGALKKAIDLIEEEQFLAMNGDSFLNVDIYELISKHNQNKAICTLSLVHVNDTTRYGRVELNSNNEITGFMEKKSGREGYINGGVYILNREVFENMPEGNTSLETDIFPKLINKGLYGVSVNGFFIDIGIPNDYLSICRNPIRILSAVER